LGIQVTGVRFLGRRSRRAIRSGEANSLGPRLVIGIAGLLVGADWIGSGYSQTTTGLYIWYAIGGIGAGAVYGGCTGNVLKWFPDHRGLCTGIVSGAYGIGTAVTVAPIEKMIKASTLAERTPCSPLS
jgi:OFA family oxalate/formate antiporter-like MFS transporter